MKPEEIEDKLKEYQDKLKALEPTLNPGKSLSFTKIGLLNIARRKAKRYQNNILVLKVLKNNPNISDELIEKMLE